MRTNQKQRILNYIREFGSITSFEAYNDLGITQLGARIVGREICFRIMEYRVK